MYAIRKFLKLNVTFKPDDNVQTPRTRIRLGKRVASEIHLEHIYTHYWYRKWHYYLYAIMQGNSCDGMPISLLLSLNLNGGLFSSIYIFFCFILTVPLIYVEIFLGRYTRMTNSQLYRLAPIFFGYCILTFFLNVLYSPFLVTGCCQFIIAALRLIIDSSYISRCITPSESCYDPLKQGKLNGSCKAEYLLINCNVTRPLRYVMQNNYWEFRYMRSGYINWEVMVASIISWMVITGFLMLGMKFLGNMLRIMVIINFLHSVILFIMAVTSKGSSKGLNNLITFNFHDLTFSQCFMTAIFSSYKLGLMTPTGYMTYSAYANLEKGVGLGVETLIITTLNIGFTIWQLTVLQSICGVLSDIMGVQLKDVFLPSTGMYYAMIPQFLFYMKAANVHIIAYHVSNWLLELSKLAIECHMLLMNFYDFFPRLTRQNGIAVPILGSVGLIISLFFSLNVFINILIPLYTNIIIYSGQAFRLFIQSLMIFFCYGVSRLNDDIHYVTGSPPVKLWRIIAYSIPCILLIGMIVETVDDYAHFHPEFELIISKKDLLGTFHYYSLANLAFFAIFIIAGSSVYVLQRINKTTLESFFKPQFFWGPPNANARVARKFFKPRSAIRSAIVKNRLSRFRENATRFIHEKDRYEGITQGRIFLDMAYKEQFPRERPDSYDFKVNIKKKMYMNLQRKVAGTTK